MENYKCSCGNKERFYNEISVVAKMVFNQKTGNEYIREKSDQVDNFLQPVYCYVCGTNVSE